MEKQKKERQGWAFSACRIMPAYFAEALLRVDFPTIYGLAPYRDCRFNICNGLDCKEISGKQEKTLGCLVEINLIKGTGRRIMEASEAEGKN